MRVKFPSRRGLAGFTLIELMVVITIIGIITAVMIPEMKGSFQDTLLRSTGRDLINVFGLAYSRAVSLNQTRRVVLDEDSGHYLVEKKVIENGEENFVPVDDVPGGKGELDARITLEFREPGEMPADGNSPAGAPAPETVPEEMTQEEKAAVTFYPDGTADAREIVLKDRQGYRLLLQVNPVTARVQIVEMEREGQL